MALKKLLPSFLADLIYGYREVIADNGEAPLRSRLEVVGATYEDDPEEGVTRLVVTGEGGTPATRTITAGPGLVGGGDLTANRTLSVRVRDGLNSALAIFGDGLGVRTNAAKGTAIEGNDLSVACAPYAGIGKLPSGLYVPIDGVTYGWPTATFTLDGLTCNVDLSTMRVTAGGICVDTAKFAALVGGKTTAAQARGRVIVNDGIVQAVGTVSPITVTSTAPATPTPIATVQAISGVQVGDRIKVFATLAASGNGDKWEVKVTSSPTPGAGTVYYAPAMGMGNAGNALVGMFTAATAGTYYMHVGAWRQGANPSFVAYDRVAMFEVHAL